MFQQTTNDHSQIFDLVIIGGGINGTGLARDAAGRGLKVLLCEQNDLASATSSASSKLIHGGLRYLEHYEFRLVREALHEREVLLKIAPHLVKPLRFRLPHAPHLRPAWMIRIGLFLYDYLARRETLPGSRGIRLNGQSPLKPEFTRAFEYSDCWVDDARLVVCNAIAARDSGATILTRTCCTGARREQNYWSIDLSSQDKHSGLEQQKTISSRCLINATGPWVSSFIEQKLQLKPEYGIRMIKGSHLVVPRIHDGSEAYILQSNDKRIIFVIPWLNKWSMIGTTDIEYDKNPGEACITDKEISYLLSLANQHFKCHLTAEDIIHSFSGVRPLCNDESNDPSVITRDYTLTIADQNGKLPLLNVFGGKLTTYRKLAQAATDKLAPYFPDMTGPWTSLRPLPGGRIKSPCKYLQVLEQSYPWLPTEVAQRYTTSYGRLCRHWLSGCSSITDLGKHFGNGLYAKEVNYLVEQEWAQCAEDILWRRTKTGVDMPEDNKQQLTDYLAQQHGLLQSNS